MTKNETGIASNGSFLSQSSMGGIVGAGGYDFQTRYIVCHFAEWTKNPEFVRFVNEGQGDVDLQFIKNGQALRRHIQVKDHDITPSELRDVISKFVSDDAGLPGVYQQFILAAPGLGATVKSFANGLQRFRGMAPFFDDIPESMNVTRAELVQRMKALDIEKDADFIIEKFDLQPGLTAFHDDANALLMFKGRMMDHPAYDDRFRGIMEGAYAFLLQHISASRGKPIEAGALDAMVQKAFQKTLKQSEPRIVIDLHNWTKEQFPLDPDLVLDWSSYFDRTRRTVPSPKIWNEILIPEVQKIKSALLAERRERLLSVQGKACLSTGILFGATFPRSGGWAIEFKQPTSEEPWRSDAPVDGTYKISIEEKTMNPDGDSVVLLFNITGKALEAVSAAIPGLQINAKTLMTVSPDSVAPGSSSIKSDAEAVSLAQCARDRLQETLERLGLRKTHIFFYGPQALALFLGQRLTSLGEIHLYEYQDPGYVPSCTFRT